jgi:hypothetical protein
MAMVGCLIVLFLIPGTFSQLKWVKLGPAVGSAPSARSDSSIGYDAKTNKAVIFGGKSTLTLGDTWNFNLATKIWSKVNQTTLPKGLSIPEPRFSMVFGAKNGSFYISTGEFSGGGKNKFYDDVVKFDIASQKWQRVEPKSSLRPEKRYGSGGGIHPSGNGLYVTHGFAGIRYSNTLKFDFKTERWETKFEGTNSYNPSYPHARCLHSAAMTGPDELVMYGGCLG